MPWTDLRTPFRPFLGLLCLASTPPTKEQSNDQAHIEVVRCAGRHRGALRHERVGLRAKRHVAAVRQRRGIVATPVLRHRVDQREHQQEIGTLLRTRRGALPPAPGQVDLGNSYTVTLEWDTTEGGRHAYDYLSSFDATESFGNDPCSGVSGCIPVPTSIVPIPTDFNVTTRGVTQAPGVFTMFGSSITAVSAYTLAGSYTGRSTTHITVTFTANQANPVLAWGGHLAATVDWGLADGGGASFIPGSSFHMGIFALSGKNVGNQNRSISGVLRVF
jgi:hypothetical protein